MTKKEIRLQIQKIREMLNNLEDELLKCEDDEFKIEIQKDETRKEKIKRYLRGMGALTNVSGCTYFVDAVEMVIDNPRLMLCDIYTCIAIEYGVEDSSVRSMISRYINYVWNECDIEKTNEILGKKVSSKTGKPTNSHAIYGMANYYIRLNL